MISEKMKQFTKNSSVIRAMFEEGKKMSEKYGAENVYDFSLGNPSIEPPISVKNAIISLLTQEAPNQIHGYTDNSGYEDVREHIAHVTNSEFSTHFSKEGVILTNGAAGALNIILKTLLNPQDEVIVFAPFFGEYTAYVANYDGKLVVIASNTETFQPDIVAFQKAITSKTKAVIINTPNNPTGIVYSENTLKSIASVLELKQKEYGNPIYLISDEPYRRLSYDGVLVPFVSKYYKNTFVAYSFSKSLSLPGERIGYILADAQMDGFEEIMFALNVANRISGFVNAPSLFQRVLLSCMEEKTDVKAYDTNRLLLYNMLTELGYECIRPEGAFYLFPKAFIANDKEFCEQAKKLHLLIVPGSAFGCAGHFRISYCVSTATITNSYDSFQKLAQKYMR